jgi:hypothetical protein
MEEGIEEKGMGPTRPTASAKVTSGGLLLGTHHPGKKNKKYPCGSEVHTGPVLAKEDHIKIHKFKISINWNF